MAVEFGLGLTFGPPKGNTAQWLDDLDNLLPQLEGHFTSLWMTDHLQWSDAPTYEAWTALSFIAARYPAFNVGPIVLGQSYRNPALLAKMAATLQALSNGRFIMGIGAGWKEDEYLSYGYPYPRPGIRLEQLEDTLEIMTRMWTQPGTVTYRGKHYEVVDAYCEPRPDPVPTLMVGGGGYKTTRLAARFADWWNIPDANWAKYKERMAVLHQHCEDLGRDPATLRLSWFGRLAVGQTEADARALAGPKWTPANAFVGTKQQVLEQIAPFIEARVDHFIPEVMGINNIERRDFVLEEVLPAIRAL